MPHTVFAAGGVEACWHSKANIWSVDVALIALFVVPCVCFHMFYFNTYKKVYMNLRLY